MVVFQSFRRTTFLALVILAVHARSQPLPKVELRPVLPGLTMGVPVGLFETPDNSGRWFLVELAGRILLVPRGSDGSNAVEFLNITNRELHQFVEDGLLGFAFHPQFSTNGLFYIYYCLHNPRRSVLSELKISAADSDRAELASERILLEIPQPFEDHKGGQLAFGPDGFLYLGLGDGGGGNDPSNNGQNTATLLGKILWLDVNGRSSVRVFNAQTNLPYVIPHDNPFAGEPDLYEHGVRREIWALGLRNPWRFGWDRETGDLWCADVGQDNWEEVNLIIKGGNYGWCVREGAHHFKPGPEGARFIDPVMEYPHNPKLLAESKFPDHGIGMCVIGGYVYRGKKFPSLRGVYVYGDYVLGTIWGFRFHDGKVAEQGVLIKQSKNITSFAQDNAGELYALSFDGHVFAITVPDAQ